MSQVNRKSCTSYFRPVAMGAATVFFGSVTIAGLALLLPQLPRLLQSMHLDRLSNAILEHGHDVKIAAITMASVGTVMTFVLPIFAFSRHDCGNKSVGSHSGATGGDPGRAAQDTIGFAEDEQVTGKKEKNPFGSGGVIKDDNNNFIDNPVSDLEVPRFVNLKDQMKQAVRSAPQHGVSSSIMNPFHRIMSGLGNNHQGALFLGNDQVRENLDKNMQMPGVKRACNEAVDDNIGGNFGSESQLLNRVDLLVSFNQGKEDGTNQFERMQHREFEHVSYSILEDKSAYSQALQSKGLKSIFNKIDEKLEAGETVFLHCNQGEHRSATIMVLYIASRAGITFEEAYAFVADQRDIKSYNQGRPTLMTTAHQMYGGKNHGELQALL